MLENYKKIHRPQSQWASMAERYGCILPQELKETGRCSAIGKEAEKDVKYWYKNEDGIPMLFLYNHCASGDNKAVCLIDDSQAEVKKKPKRKKSASDGTDTASEEQAKEREAEKKRLADIKAKYRSYEPATDNNAYLQRKGVPCVAGLKQDGQDLIVPSFDYKDDVTGLLRIKSDGEKCLVPGSPWGVFTIQGLPDTVNQNVLVCEGIATGISLWYSTFATVVVAGCAGNMTAGAGYAKEHFPGHPVICCADNDNSGGENVGLSAARQAAMVHGCFVAVPPAADGEKMDFNDLYIKYGREKVAKVVADATKQGTVKIPDKFSLRSDGLFAEIKRDGKYVTERISKSPLEVMAWARPINGENSWALQVRWKDPDGYWREVLLPISIIGSDPRLLSDMIGKSYITNWSKYRNEIYEYLTGTETSRRIDLVDRCGWVDDHLYVTPNRYFGSSPIPVQPSVLADMAEFTPKGSLDEFKEFTRLAQGNYIFVVALCAAFAAPLLGLANQEPGGLHFVGQSSCGKTTALVMPTGVWRNPKYISSWNTTDNALEFVASKYHDSLLTIDEISQVSSQALYKSLYMLANGAGKKRCTSAKSGIREASQRHWRLFFLSTGEEDIELKLRKDGFTPMAGQAVRLATVPVEDDHIRNLHGYKTKTDFLTAIRNLAENSYGVAGERFLEYLTAYVGPLRKGLPDIITKYETELCEPYCAEGKQIDNQIRRVAARFALCIVGGCLASAWGIIDISQDEIVQAVTEAFVSWIEHRGGTQSAETIAIVNGTRELLEKYSRNFVVCDFDPEYSIYSPSGSVDEISRKKTIETPPGGIYGYIVTKPGKEGYYLKKLFFENILPRELGKSLKVVKTILLNEAILKRGSKDHVGTRFTPPYEYGESTKGKASPDRYYRILYPDMFSVVEPSEPEPVSESEDSVSETAQNISFDI